VPLLPRASTLSPPVHQGVDLGLDSTVVDAPRPARAPAPAPMEITEDVNASVSEASASVSERSASDVGVRVHQAVAPDARPATFFGAVRDTLRRLFAMDA